MYDTKKERLIVTKKDKVLQNLPEEDYEICNEGAGTVVFENFSDTIADMEAQGYTFIGIENCRLKFTRTTYTTVTETRTITVSFLMKQRFMLSMILRVHLIQVNLQIIRASVQAWYNDLVANGHTGALHNIDISTERWLGFPFLLSLLVEV